ncbi:GNAT family N-acetyltransferase [Gemmatimonadota bacterium]
MPDRFLKYLHIWDPAHPDSPPESRDASVLLGEAERIIANDLTAEVPVEEWRHYLDWTRRSRFLRSLPDQGVCRRWAETTFPAILLSGMNLRTILEQRVEEHPDRTLFQEMANDRVQKWSYAQVGRRASAMAAALIASSGGEPTVAIYAENSVDGACCDLACLLYDIPVSPLNTHLDVDELTDIFQRLDVNIAVTDTYERFERLMAVREIIDRPFQIYLFDPESVCDENDCISMNERLAGIRPEEVERILSQRSLHSMTDTATVMFTSGSTGRQKGVCFSQFNMITKRFARAAALPAVGENEVLLSYLPLFHTFGRFLELQGMIFWGGTYVFAGSSAADRLITLLPEVQPTGLISIPARWEQIYERCLEQMRGAAGEGAREEAFHRVVGDRLRWGLSAAGYQDPQVFRFFEEQGVDLCSGFGMTEATGGITMTPPGEYEDKTVGIPLPGVYTRFSDLGELQVAGPYIARYLDHEQDDEESGNDGGEIDVDRDQSSGDTEWLRTGDLFAQTANGYLQIIDRIKDIYKSSRGQTIAPLRVERKFTGVPGIKRTFLVGDGRYYNTLLIVPDHDDPVIKAADSREELESYFHQIIASANRDLAPYERVVNFDLLERDFDSEKDELTPKGSYKRKQIEKNFNDTIERLYERYSVDLSVGELTVHIPHWFFRDLGILDGDIVVAEEGLFNRLTMRTLPLRRLEDGKSILIGDLVYSVEGDRIDLGFFSRMTILWMGNPDLIQFAPCKEGWDLPMGDVSAQVRLPFREDEGYQVPEMPGVSLFRDSRLAVLNTLFVKALFGKSEEAPEAVDELDGHLRRANPQIADLIRHRLGALAYHPVLKVRAAAYRILLLDEPVHDYSVIMPMFLQSGLPFLDDGTIALIAGSSIERRKLESLRQRLHSYRIHLDWPADESTRRILSDVLQMLCGFARYNPEFYAAIRAELVAWSLHDLDPELAADAHAKFDKLATWFEEYLKEVSPPEPPGEWEGKIDFQELISGREVEKLRKVLVGTTFLSETLFLAFEATTFSIRDVPPHGIWVSRALSLQEHRLYRVSINTTGGRHFDVLIVLGRDPDEASILATNYWLIALRGNPYGSPVVPAFGCSRAELGAYSLQYTGELSVWERIREYSGWRYKEGGLPAIPEWRTLYIRAMAAFFRGWLYSGKRIVPGDLSPMNIVVPEPDFRRGSRILSIAGWSPFSGPLSLVKPLMQNFYLQTVNNYPRVRARLEIRWIFDACIETLGVTDGVAFLRDLLDEIDVVQSPGLNDLPEAIEEVLAEVAQAFYAPLNLRGAVERYHEWEFRNPDATASAKEDQIRELYRLYRLDRLPDISRYWLYRHTYFRRASRAVSEAMDALLMRMFNDTSRRPTQMVELSDLQSLLEDADDRLVFSRLVFPTAADRMFEVVEVTELEKKKVIVRSEIVDKQGDSYTVRSPLEPAEVGKLYRVFVRAGYQVTLSDRDRYLLIIDAREQVVGGIRYRIEAEEVVYLDGIVVIPSLMDRGISSALLEDFCSRMAGRGMKVVRTHYHIRHFYLRHGFQVHERWGGLVRFLEPDASVDNV